MLGAPVPLEAILGDATRRGGLVSWVLVAGALGVGAAARNRRGVVLRGAVPVAAVATAATIWDLVGQPLSTSVDGFAGNPGHAGGYGALLLGAARLAGARTPRWSEVRAMAPVGLWLIAAGDGIVTKRSLTNETIKANGITINYEDRGPADGKPLLLVNGYTSTMMSWPAALMDGLKAKGFRVIRYDFGIPLQ